MDGLKMMTIFGSFQGNGGSGNSGGGNANGGRKISWLQEGACLKDGGVYLLDASTDACENAPADFRCIKMEPFGHAELHISFKEDDRNVSFPVAEGYGGKWYYNDTNSSYAAGPFDFNAERDVWHNNSIFSYDVYNNGNITSMTLAH